MSSVYIRRVNLNINANSFITTSSNHQNQRFVFRFREFLFTFWKISKNRIFFRTTQHMTENLVYQIDIDKVPHLAKIFDVFDLQCRYPSNAERFRLNMSVCRHRKRFGTMREDCERNPDIEMYKRIEKQRKLNQRSEKKRTEMKEGMHVRSV